MRGVLMMAAAAVAAHVMEAASPALQCAPCHAARVRAQAASPHAHALQPYTGEHFAGRSLRERGGRAFSFTAESLRVSEGEAAVEAPVRWAFGSGVQAVTPVLLRNGQWVEHRVSWYRRGDRLSLTPGHAATPPLELEDALGVVQTESNAGRCFGCHTTLGEPGVTCQACHGEGSAHRTAPAKGNIGRDRAVALCATCHRSPGREFASLTPEIEDPLSVRFAPVGLQASRCFRDSQPGRLTCVTCHDPHTLTLARPIATVCRSCHRPVAAGARGGRGCPRTPDCAGCHMPESAPVPNLRFTDHRIR